MKNNCSEGRFLSDVKSHEMTIVRDDGLNRHLRFRNPERGAYWFDLITWDGYLCISGDCGTYVFRRIPDMFNFFIMSESDFNNDPNKKLNINTGYWEGKCEAFSRHGGIKEFNPELFELNIKDWFDEYFEDGNHDEFKEDCWDEITLALFGFSKSEEYDAIRKAVEFEHLDSGFTMQDFWEVKCQEYTFSYIWNCYAIVWGILKYREVKEKI